MLKNILAVSAAFLLLGCATTLPTSHQVTLETPRDWTLPNDPSIRQGVLENGLTWYTQALTDNGHRDRVELRLRVRAGSLEETTEQSGLAHFVEHMAFNGTARYPKMRIVNFLEAAGVHFGSDINAHTYFDETVYKLSLPADRPDLINQGFEILYDWATAVTFDPTEVKKEALVVESEWREDGGAVKGISDLVYRNIYQGTRYATRLPIGSMKVVRKATPEQLRAYYQQWYRPDNMEVYVVYPQGLMDAEARIKATFDEWQSPPVPTRDWQAGEVDVSSVRIQTFSSPSYEDCTWQLYLPTRTDYHSDNESQEAKYIEMLTGFALSSRFENLHKNHELTLYRGDIELDSFIDGTPYLRAMFSVDDCDAWLGLKEGVTELKRFKRHGLTPSEFAIARAQTIANINDKLDAIASGSVADSMDQLLQAVIEGNARTDSAEALRVTRRIAETLTYEQVNAYLAALYPSDRVIGYYYYPADKSLKERNWQAAYHKAWRASAKAPKDSELSALELDYAFPGTVVSRTDQLEDQGLYQWTLSNGLSVILKPSQLEPGRVQLSGILLGGLRQIPEADYVAANYWPYLRMDTGFGQLSLQDFEDRLLVENIEHDVSLRDSFLKISLQGKSSSTEQLLKLMAGILTETDYEPSLTVSLVFGYANYLKQEEVKPSEVFYQAYEEALLKEDPVYRVYSSNDVRKILINQLQSVPEVLMKNHHGAFLVIVGDITPEAIEPLLTANVAGLPFAPETAPETQAQPLAQDRIVTKKGQSDGKTEVRYALSAANWPTTLDNLYTAKIVEDIIEHRLENSLREELGLTYGTSVFQTYQTPQDRQWLLNIRFDTDPKRQDYALRVLDKELLNVVDSVITEQEVAEAKLRLREYYKRQLQTNSGIERRLYLSAVLGADFAQYDDYESGIQKVTLREVRAMAYEWVFGNRVVARFEPDDD